MAQSRQSWPVCQPSGHFPPACCRTATLLPAGQAPPGTCGPARERGAALYPGEGTMPSGSQQKQQESNLRRVSKRSLQHSPVSRTSRHPRAVTTRRQLLVIWVAAFLCVFSRDLTALPFLAFIPRSESTLQLDPAKTQCKAFMDKDELQETGEELSGLKAINCDRRNRDQLWAQAAGTRRQSSSQHGQVQMLQSVGRF